MDIKKITLSGVLFAVGLILHQLIPGIFGIKPDIQLAVLFIVILINNSFKGALASGFVSGIITSLTTTFPGGQIPNFIDKIVSCIIMYFAIKLFSKFLNNFFTMALSGFVGTVISGTVFLTSAFYIVGLPGGMTLGFGLLTVVIPTAAINVFVTPLLYKLVSSSAKYVGKTV